MNGGLEELVRDVAEGRGLRDVGRNHQGNAVVHGGVVFCERDGAVGAVVGGEAAEDDGDAGNLIGYDDAAEGFAGGIGGGAADEGGAEGTGAGAADFAEGAAGDGQGAVAAGGGVAAADGVRDGGGGVVAEEDGASASAANASMAASFPQYPFVCMTSSCCRLWPSWSYHKPPTRAETPLRLEFSQILQCRAMAKLSFVVSQIGRAAPQCPR